MLQSCDKGQTALLPLRRKACWGFFLPRNPTDSDVSGVHDGWMMCDTSQLRNAGKLGLPWTTGYQCCQERPFTTHFSESSHPEEGGCMFLPKVATLKRYTAEIERTAMKDCKFTLHYRQGNFRVQILFLPDIYIWPRTLLTLFMKCINSPWGWPLEVCRSVGVYQCKRSGISIH
jgi:hypothetical protein